MINKKFFFILNLTWGLPMTLIGAIVAAFLIISGHKPKRWNGCVYFNVGESWGGLELGLFFLTDKNDRISTKNHEFGHSIQNAIFGPLMPFIVCIPSAVRYWYHKYRDHKGLPNKPYDSIWFEKQATDLGSKYKTTE